MSLCLTASMICDGCGHVIGRNEFYMTRRPTHHHIIPMATQTTEERHFCSPECELAWHAMYPNRDVWGPAWKDRARWRLMGGPQSNLTLHIIKHTAN